jgi:hypothetical protein
LFVFLDNFLPNLVNILIKLSIDKMLITIRALMINDKGVKFLATKLLSSYNEVLWDFKHMTLFPHYGV